MLRTFVVASVAALALSACGSSPQALCKDITATTCNKLYTCYTGAELDGIKTIYGASESECATKLQTMSNCDKAEPCETGQTYNASEASKCASDFKGLSCDAVKGSMFPSSCNNVCK